MMAVMLASISIPTAQAATISGGVYDGELQTVDKVVVYINSTPIQRIASRYGGFQFQVDPGHYKIFVEYTANNITKVIAEDVFVITDPDGAYRRDIFIFEHIDLIEDFNNAAPPSSQPVFIKVILLIIATVVCLGCVIGAYAVIRRRQRQPNTIEPDDVTKDKILALIKEAKGQISQMHIRKQIPLSESKISMLLSDLEKEGKIQKVKNGRVNMIVLVP